MCTKLSVQIYFKIIYLNWDICKTDVLELGLMHLNRVCTYPMSLSSPHQEWSVFVSRFASHTTKVVESTVTVLTKGAAEDSTSVSATLQEPVLQTWTVAGLTTSTSPTHSTPCSRGEYLMNWWHPCCPPTATSRQSGILMMLVTHFGKRPCRVDYTNLGPRDQFAI